MNAKKILTLIVAVAMMLSVFVVPANAEISATNLVLALPTTVAVEAGEDFDLELKLTGFMAMAEFQVTYDADYFTYVGFAASNTSGIGEKSTEEGKIVLNSLAFANLGGAEGWDKALGTLSFKAKDASALGDNASVTKTISVSDFYIESTGVYSIADDSFHTYNSTEGYTATFTNASVTVSKPPVAPKLTGTLAVSETAKINTPIVASGVTGADDNGDDVTIDYKWYRVAEDDSETLIDGATDASYTPVAADFDCKIKVVATATTTVEPTTGDSQSAVTTGKVLADETATATVENVKFDGDVIVGMPAQIVYDFTASDNGGSDASEVSVTADEGSTMYGTFDPVAKTYTADAKDLNEGTVIVVNVTAKGNRDTATSAATPFKFDCSNAKAGNMAPSVEDLAIKVKDQAVEYAVVDDELVVSYTWKDVADEEDEDETYVTDDPKSNASTIAWKIDGEVVSTGTTYKVTKEHRGKEITVEVTPISLDTTPNDKIGTEENPYDVVNGKVESKTIAIKANPNYVPTVSNVNVPSVEIIWDKPFEIDWEFADKNGYADESVVSFLYGDGTDASAVITNNGNGTYTIASDKKETIGEKTIKFRVQATKSAAATSDGVSYVPELKYVDSKEYTVIEAVSSGSGSIKNPTLGGGGTTPTVSPQPTTTPEPTDAPVVVPAAKDCITLTIGKTDVNVFGDAKANDVAPVIRNDRTMLPARIVAEALGAKVSWDGEARKVTITKGDVTIVITIDADKALVNGEEVTLDSHAFIEKDRTYLPMRFLGEKLGAEVTWNAATQEVYIVPGK